jgi:MFS superfamily sulfate permease-like transporter
MLFKIESFLSKPWWLGVGVIIAFIVAILIIIVALFGKQLEKIGTSILDNFRSPHPIPPNVNIDKLKNQNQNTIMLSKIKDFLSPLPLSGYPVVELQGK